MKESISQFEQRKSDHLRIALDPRSQTEGQGGLDSIQMIHEALPEMDFSEVDISTSFIFKDKKIPLSSPLFISSMTAGHEKGLDINQALTRLSDRRQIMMGVGSQRRELTDAEAAREWKTLRKQAPKALLLGNLGMAQLIRTPLDQVQRLVESTEALALFVHLNPLQECLQPEGTPHFKGAFAALEKLVKTLPVPVIVKEVGCGFSTATLKRLEGTGVHAVDISGLGGTHWGRIEGYRSGEEQILHKVAKTFANWGLSTLQCMRNAQEARVNYEIWASGGVRSGLDAAKLLALGANKVGVAQPFLEAALQGDEALENLLQRLELELKISMFCTGCRDLKDLHTKRVIQ